MLIELIIKNFGPIMDESVLSMLRLEQSDGSDYVTTPVAGIFGSNASGKTKVLESLEFITTLVRESGSYPVGRQLADVGFRFVDTSMPTSFTLSFRNEGLNEYSLSLEGGSIVSESLSVDGEKVFDRGGDGIVISDAIEDYDRKIMEMIKDTTDVNNLFLSRCMQFRVGCTKDAVDWFMNKVVWPDPMEDIRADIYSMKDRVIDMLSNADFGISDFNIDDMWPTVDKGLNELKDPTLTHTILVNGVTREYDLPFKDESRGTRSFMLMIPRILKVLDQGGLMIMDELGAGLHPLLVDYIIGLFRSEEKNPKGAQLLFTTHDPMIPERNELDADQIWFTTRDPLIGRTSLYPLTEYEIDDQYVFVRDYLSGRLGAVPRIKKW